MVGIGGTPLTTSRLSMTLTNRRQTAPGRETPGRGTPGKDATSRLSMMVGSAMKFRINKANDPRPVSDRQYMLQCVRKITTFVSSTGYPHSLAPKFVLGPTGKEFKDLIQFLYQLIDPNAPLWTRKLEEELPDMFQRIRYPLAITKASLLLVASPQTWPGVLAALHWMVELLSIDAKIINPYLYATDASGILASKDGAKSSALAPSWVNGEWRMKFETLARTYKAFLHGQDQMLDELRSERSSQASAIQKRREEELKENQREKEKLEKRLSELEKRPKLSQIKDRVAELRKELFDRKASLNSDKAKLKQLQESLRLQKKIEADIKKEHEKLEGEKGRLDHVVQTQPISVEEQKELLRERTQLVKKDKELTKELADLEARHRELESKAQNALKRRDEIREEVKPLLGGQKFDVRFNEQQQAVADAEACREELKEQKISVSQALAQEQERLKSNQERSRKLEDEIHDMREQLSTAERDYNEERYADDSETERRNAELRALQEQTITLRKERENASAYIEKKRNEIEGLKKAFLGVEQPTTEGSLREFISLVRTTKSLQVRALVNLETSLSRKRDCVEKLEAQIHDAPFIKPSRKSMENRRSLTGLAKVDFKVHWGDTSDDKLELKNFINMVDLATGTSSSSSSRKAPGGSPGDPNSSKPSNNNRLDSFSFAGDFNRNDSRVDRSDFPSFSNSGFPSFAKERGNCFSNNHNDNEKSLSDIKEESHRQGSPRSPENKDSIGITTEGKAQSSGIVVPKVNFPTEFERSSGVANGERALSSHTTVERATLSNRLGERATRGATGKESPIDFSRHIVDMSRESERKAVLSARDTSYSFEQYQKQSFEQRSFEQRQKQSVEQRSFEQQSNSSQMQQQHPSVVESNPATRPKSEVKPSESPPSKPRDSNPASPELKPPTPIDKLLKSARDLLKSGTAAVRSSSIFGNKSENTSARNSNVGDPGVDRDGNTSGHTSAVVTPRKENGVNVFTKVVSETKGQTNNSQVTNSGETNNQLTDSGRTNNQVVDNAEQINENKENVVHNDRQQIQNQLIKKSRTVKTPRFNPADTSKPAGASIFNPCSRSVFNPAQKGSGGGSSVFNPNRFAQQAQYTTSLRGIGINGGTSPSPPRGPLGEGNTADAETLQDVAPGKSSVANTPGPHYESFNELMPFAELTPRQQYSSAPPSSDYHFRRLPLSAGPPSAEPSGGFLPQSGARSEVSGFDLMPQAFNNVVLQSCNTSPQRLFVNQGDATQHVVPVQVQQARAACQAYRHSIPTYEPVQAVHVQQYQQQGQNVQPYQHGQPYQQQTFINVANHDPVPGQTSTNHDPAQGSVNQGNVLQEDVNAGNLQPQVQQPKKPIFNIAGKKTLFRNVNRDTAGLPA